MKRETLVKISILTAEYISDTEQALNAVKNTNLSKNKVTEQWILQHKKAIIFENEVQKIKEEDAIDEYVEKRISDLLEGHKTIYKDMVECGDISEYDN